VVVAAVAAVAPGVVEGGVAGPGELRPPLLEAAAG